MHPPGISRSVHRIRGGNIFWNYSIRHTFNYILPMEGFSLISIPIKCWLNARMRGTNVSTSCSPLSSSAALSMASTTKSTNE